MEVKQASEHWQIDELCLYTCHVYKKPGPLTVHELVQLITHILFVEADTENRDERIYR